MALEFKWYDEESEEFSNERMELLKKLSNDYNSMKKENLGGTVIDYNAEITEVKPTIFNPPFESQIKKVPSSLIDQVFENWEFNAPTPWHWHNWPNSEKFTYQEFHHTIDVIFNFSQISAHIDAVITNAKLQDFSADKEFVDTREKMFLQVLIDDILKRLLGIKEIAGNIYLAINGALTLIVNGEILEFVLKTDLPYLFEDIKINNPTDSFRQKLRSFAIECFDVIEEVERHFAE